jgi:cell shape-determining protein MreC
MREIRRRLTELKKENEELKQILAISGKSRQEYENKVNSPILNNIDDRFDRHSRFNTWNRTTVNASKNFINPS